MIFFSRYISTCPKSSPSYCNKNQSIRNIQPQNNNEENPTKSGSAKHGKCSRRIWLLPTPSPPSSPVSRLSLFLSLSVCVAGRAGGNNDMYLGLEFLPDWPAISVSSDNSKVWSKWYGLAQDWMSDISQLAGGGGGGRGGVWQIIPWSQHYLAQGERQGEVCVLSLWNKVCEERNHTTTRKPCPLQISHFLWFRYSRLVLRILDVYPRSRIPALESKRFRIPDPNQHQRI